MTDVHKKLQSHEQLLILIDEATKGQKRLADAKIEIRPIPENQRGENFELNVLNKADLGPIQQQELSDVLARILGTYSLSR